MRSRARPNSTRPPVPNRSSTLPGGSGRFGNVTLRWHYRSRHEALIAFSNAAFYEGRLLPVPGGGPAEAIELFHGEGAYRGRTTRDNPARPHGWRSESSTTTSTAQP